MRPITKLLTHCLVLLLLSASSTTVWASDVQGQALTLPTPNGATAVELYAAPGADHHPAVLILHGRQGLAPFYSHYQHFAVALAEAGIDAYLLSYYSGNDSQVANDPNSEQGRAFFTSRFRDWTHLIKAITTDILTGTRSSGKIGLLGFSQGGFLATTVAGQDPRISALGVFYGGIPAAARHKIVQLPPLLELHGDADRIVPLAEGKALVTLAKGLGQSAEMVVYPGAGHGFYGTDDLDSIRRVRTFFCQNLQSMACAGITK